MKFSLIICTYQRPQALLTVLESVELQTTYPNQILVIDGSTDIQTERAVGGIKMMNLEYFRVSDKNRGLTRQRNFGIHKVATNSEVICFLDDDVILEKNYFEEILKCFNSNNSIIGVGGVAINDNRWKKTNKKKSTNKFYVYDGYEYEESQRFYLRNFIGLQPSELPGVMPDFSHPRTSGYPLTGKYYEVDLLVGMAMSYRKIIFNYLSFSHFFENYGLYEDADFSLRALTYGKNVINTSAQLKHYHHPSGRPRHYEYGKMVIRNGWYIWRIKNSKPTLKNRFKWNATAFLLTLIRLSNAITSNDKRGAFKEAMGRISAWFGLLFRKPNI